MGAEVVVVAVTAAAAAVGTGVVVDAAAIFTGAGMAAGSTGADFMDTDVSSMGASLAQALDFTATDTPGGVGTTRTIRTTDMGTMMLTIAAPTRVIATPDLTHRGQSKQLWLGAGTIVAGSTV
jgi:hypothetical protein